MFRAFQNLRTDEEGQSIVLACVALLILALGVMTTVNLGRAIHQRIALQNTADSSAYSQAAMEARAFNYYAFANRTQVVHYVSAMILQSYISFFGFLQAMTATIVAMLDTANGCNDAGFCEKFACKAIQALPVIGEIFTAIIEAVAAIDAVAKRVLELINGVYNAMDIAIGEVFIPGLRIMNWLLWASTELVAEDVVTDIADGYTPVITKTDNQASDNNALVKAAVALVNADEFKNAHNTAAGGGPAGIPKLPDNSYGGSGISSSGTDLDHAKHGMGEVANATRYNKFVVSRLLTDFLPSFAKDFINVIQDVPGLDLYKYGQTKLASIPIDSSGTWNQIHDTGFGSTVLAEGNVLGADDLFLIGMGPAKLLWVKNPFVSGDSNLSPGGLGRGRTRATVVSVWAQKNPDDGQDGKHWRLLPNQDGADSDGISHDDIPTSFCGLRLFYAEIGLDNNDHHHPWGGLTPYQAFEPDTSYSHQFNQPGTFAYLNKTYDQTRRNQAGQDLMTRTGIKETTGVAGVGPAQTIDAQDDVAMPTPFESGSYNVISYGMAYYHRPHNWEEPPNFFNPYWHAKLEPVSHGLDALPGVGKLFNSIPSNIIDKVLVH